MVNSRFELFKTRQQFCGDISILFQSHSNHSGLTITLKYSQNITAKFNVVFFLKARILSLQDVVFGVMYMYVSFARKIAELVARFSTSHQQVVFELLVPTCKKLRREYQTFNKVVLTTLIQTCCNNIDRKFTTQG